MTPTDPRRITLRTPRTDQELDVIVEWLGTESTGTALTSDLHEAVDREKIRHALSMGLQLRLVIGVDGSPLGIVTWKQRGHARAYELAILIGDPELWATGVGAQAAMRAVDYLFMTVGAERVMAMSGDFNPFTSAALARAGFTLEGLLRSYHFVDGEFRDALIWSLLREEHRALLDAAAHTPLAYEPMIPEADKARGRAIVERLLSDSGLPRSWAAPTLGSREAPHG